MLLLRGSNCRRSRGSTWYDRMEKLLMGLGFTKIKVDSKIYFKVEGRRTMMLLLYADEPFLTGEEELIKDTRRILSI